MCVNMYVYVYIYTHTHTQQALNLQDEVQRLHDAGNPVTMEREHR